jgi:hypothetical protein
VSIKYKKSSLKRLYGISLDEFEKMKFEQGGLCAVTGCGNNAVAVDHCHATGRVRGLLCNGCNAALGFINEDVNRAIGLAMYIQRNCKGES